jgi:hypothetical protein
MSFGLALPQSVHPDLYTQSVHVFLPATRMRRGRALGWVRPEEMSVERAGMPLILKALDKSCLEKMQKRFDGGIGGRVTYRMDKLGNRTSFSRQLVLLPNLRHDLSPSGRI